MADRTFYRIVGSDPPEAQHFSSNDTLGRQPPGRDPEVLRLWAGVSVYSSEERARRRARSRPHLGRFIAELRVPDDGPIQYERTGNTGHYTLWGDAEAMLACVVLVVPV